MLPVDATKMITGDWIRTVIKINKGIGMMEDDINISGK